MLTTDRWTPVVARSWLPTLFALGSAPQSSLVLSKVLTSARGLTGIEIYVAIFNYLSVVVVPRIQQRVARWLACEARAAELNRVVVRRDELLLLRRAVGLARAQPRFLRARRKFFYERFSDFFCQRFFVFRPRVVVVLVV